MCYQCINEHRPYRFCSRASGPNINIIRAWSWVEKAEYRGHKEFNKRKVDIWAYNVSLTLSLTCSYCVLDI